MSIISEVSLHSVMSISSQKCQLTCLIHRITRFPLFCHCNVCVQCLPADQKAPCKCSTAGANKQLN